MIKYYLQSHLDILFVGINPHHGSHARGVPFSNNKMFWYLLSDAGLIPATRSQLRDDNFLYHLYTKLFAPVYKLGLINLIDRPTREISLLQRGEEKVGRKRLTHAIDVYHPTVVCFIGKATYQLFIGHKTCEHGWQKDIASSHIYVMHTPLRGAAAIRIEELQELATFCKRELVVQNKF